MDLQNIQKINTLYIFKMAASVDLFEFRVLNLNCYFFYITSDFDQTCNELHALVSPFIPFHRDDFNSFEYRARFYKQSRPRPGSSWSCLIRLYSVCLWKYDISNRTLVDPQSHFFAPCTNVKVYLYNYP